MGARVPRGLVCSCGAHAHRCEPHVSLRACVRRGGSRAPRPCALPQPYGRLTARARGAAAAARLRGGLVLVGGRPVRGGEAHGRLFGSMTDLRCAHAAAFKAGQQCFASLRSHGKRVPETVLVNCRSSLAGRHVSKLQMARPLHKPSAWAHRSKSAQGHAHKDNWLQPRHKSRGLSIQVSKPQSCLTLERARGRAHACPMPAAASHSCEAANAGPT